jgi:hypothetical protein
LSSRPGESTVDLAGPSANGPPPRLERENLLVADETTKEIGRVSLIEALELTMLIAEK